MPVSAVAAFKHRRFREQPIALLLIHIYVPYGNTVMKRNEITELGLYGIGNKSIRSIPIHRWTAGGSRDRKKNKKKT